MGNCFSRKSVSEKPLVSRFANAPASAVASLAAATEDRHDARGAAARAAQERYEAQQAKLKQGREKLKGR